MKSFHIEQWISLNRFTPGRRAFCAGTIKQAARGRWSRVDERCDAIVAAEREQIALLIQFKSGQALDSTAQWTPELVALDAELDRLITELRDILAAQSTRKSPRGAASKALLDAHFAQGLPFYTQQIFEEESARVGVLTNALRGAPEQVALAGIDDCLADVAAAHDRYADLVKAHEKPARVAYDSVKQADLDNQRNFLELITIILNATGELTPAERDLTRKELLTIVAQHDAELSALVRARRRIADVDPDSGQPETDPVP